MTRRALFKFLALLPFVGPAITKAVVKSDFKPALPYSKYPYLPQFFPKWDRAVDGLEEAGKWALEIEQSRLSSDVVVPRVGQVWEAVRDYQVAYRPHGSWQLPGYEKVRDDKVALRPSGWRVSAGGKATFVIPGGLARLQAGERIRILGLDHPHKPLRISFQPLRYAELHGGIVPDEIRQMPGYAGYELSVKSAKTVTDIVLAGKAAPQTFFNEAFRLVADVA